jgi:hypothetical protein
MSSRSSVFYNDRQHLAAKLRTKRSKSINSLAAFCKKALPTRKGGRVMSVHKDPRSPYWHYNFQINGQRYYGSTSPTPRRSAIRM